jgi:hypothetical protein
MKVGKKKRKSPSIFLATYWNLSYKSGNFEFSRNLANLGPFFPWKIICVGRNNIFQGEI